MKKFNAKNIEVEIKDHRGGIIVERQDDNDTYHVWVQINSLGSSDPWQHDGQFASLKVAMHHVAQILMSNVENCFYEF